MSDLTRGTTFTSSIPSAAAAHNLVDAGSINKEFITAKTTVDCAAGDLFVISDVSDSNNLKKTTGLSIINAIAGATGSALIVAGSSQAALEAIGATTIGSVMITAGSVGAVFTSLGVTTVGSSVMQAVNAGSARTSLGFGNVWSGSSQIFTSSGSFVKANLPATTANVTIECWGAGGGGGGGNSSTNWRGVGGGGGGYARKHIAISLLAASETVTIGAGGVAGSTSASPSAGSVGGTTSFGSVCIATGGAGGTAATGAALSGVAGGIGSVGDLLLSGDTSMTMFGGVSTTQVSEGGDAPYFNGGGKSVGTSAFNYGGGGACANHTGGLAGTGGNGLVIVSW